MFQRTPFGFTKPLSHRENRQSLLHVIGGGWHMKKLNEKLPPLDKQKLSKKAQEKKDEIKNLQMAYQN